MKELNFIKFKNIAFIFSGLLLLMGLILYVIGGGFSYGIDFAGGVQIQVGLKGEIVVRELEGVLGENASVIKVGSEDGVDGGADAGRSSFLIKAKVGESLAEEELKEYVSKQISILSDKHRGLVLDGEILYTANEIRFKLKKEGIKGGDKGGDKGRDKGRDKGEDVDAVDKVELLKHFGSRSEIESNEEGFGVILSVNDLITDKLLVNPLQERYKEVTIDSKTTYDPTQGEVIKGQALKVSLLVLVLILLYIGLRFQFKFGIAAIVALLHDVLILISFILLFGREIDTTIIVALLTIMGYSLNDTIIVFDRIRENQQLLTTQDYVLVVNKSISQSLSRTMVTSLTTLFVVLCIYVYGGKALENLSFALLIGVFVGTYSSIFIASPILVLWEDLMLKRGRDGGKKRKQAQA